ncbi:MAG: ribonuclease PH [SAR324 cluster bacterium]|nr:ribonuclease PH [SAR324 cluster bacterium]
MPRSDGRRVDEPRPIQITTKFTRHAQGSVLIESGNTQVICTAFVEDGVPGFMRGEGKGWLTAEYGMLPSSTMTRKKRSTAGKVDGRAQEIQRLIGRSLRAIVDLGKMGERTIWIDCDVIQADGGTRTASITGGFVALVLALRNLHENNKLKRIPITQYMSAISVGIFNNRTLLDLNYEEDRDAEVDLNVVMLDNHALIEVQGTAEGKPFTRLQFNEMLDFAEIGMLQNFVAQKNALDGYLIKK